MPSIQILKILASINQVETRYFPWLQGQADQLESSVSVFRNSNFREKNHGEFNIETMEKFEIGTIL